VRHSYASAALAAGIPAKVVSERLGHATIAVTMDIYSHVLPGMDERAAQTAASLILGGGPAPPPRALLAICQHRASRRQTAQKGKHHLRC
jgi:hypothetical protein